MTSPLGHLLEEEFSEHRRTVELKSDFPTPGHRFAIEPDRDAIQRGLRSFYYDTALSATDRCSRC
jgi:hypothetical protein